MHIVIMGCGRVGASLARALERRGHSVAVIDIVQDSFRRLGPEFQGKTVKGVGFDRQVLQRAGIEPVLISKITDDKDHLLSETRLEPPTESERTIAARNAFIMNSLLQEVTRSGTAARAQATLKRSDIYGKTGTTNDSMDAWFAGFHPTLTAIVWIGYDTPRNLGSRETGGGTSGTTGTPRNSRDMKSIHTGSARPPPVSRSPSLRGVS